MAKKELYYFCVSVDDGTKPRTERPHYYGFTIATSESKAQSQACSYINATTDYGKDGIFECTVEVIALSKTKSNCTAVPDTAAIKVYRHGVTQNFEII